MKHLLLTTIAAVLVVGCGKSSIHQAAYDGDIQAIKQHLVDGMDVNAKDADGWTPLSTAAHEGHREVAELLIAKGADVNAKEDMFGLTPLHVARNKEIAELLIAEGADVNAKNDKGRTPLDWAEDVDEDDSPEVEAARKETADLLRKHGGKTGEELKAEGK